jgi:hypothetical protein
MQKSVAKAKIIKALLKTKIDSEKADESEIKQSLLIQLCSRLKTNLRI